MVPNCSALVEQWLDSAQQRWPQLRLSEGELSQLRVSLLAGVEVKETNAADFVLAMACAQGNAKALRIFEDEFLPKARAALRKVDRVGNHVDDLLQLVRERLLVAAPDALPRIAHYNGKGSLQGYVRVTASRLALNRQRVPANEVLVDDDALFAEAPATQFTAITTGKRFAPHVAKALREGFEKLGARERTLLRLHYLDGLTIDELVSHEKSHRSTVARRIAVVRESLLAHARNYLQEHFQLSESEVDGVVYSVVASAADLDVSIHRMLATPAGD